MGFLDKLPFFKLHSGSGPKQGRALQRKTLAGPHSCRFETLEPRQMLAADIHFGAFYLEYAAGEDAIPNRFEITFEGGAEGTTLNRIIIDGDKLENGEVTMGDVFFDTETGGLGVYAAWPLQIETPVGFSVVNASVADSSSLLIIDLENFTVGDKLVFTIDVDEMAFFRATSLVEGAEFEGTRITGEFTAPHYESSVLTAVYYDIYDGNFQAVADQTGSTLNLPPQRYTAEHEADLTDMTAGAVAHTPQTPLPIAIAGTVFVDQNLNNFQDPEDQGLAGVALDLHRLEGDVYVPTGLTTVTDEHGNYRFDDASIVPGTYKIVQTQPDGYFSVGASPGEVAGEQRGTVLTSDILTGIELRGGEESLQNDFAEALPGSLGGFVYHDHNNDGIRDPGEEGIAGSRLQVIPVSTVDGQGMTPIEVLTATDGSWFVGNLRPGSYRVVQVEQPAGFMDGLDTPGSLGGVAVNPGDEINDIVMLSGQAGVEYNFGEIKPGSISGFVYHDRNNDGVRDSGEEGIAGAKLTLLDAQGNVVATTLSASDGHYEFTGLTPGVYTIEQAQPDGWLDGLDTPGSLGGVAENPGDAIRQIVVNLGENGVEYNFGELLPGSISGRVHANVDGNCTLDPGDILLEGVRIDLLDSEGNLLATTHTDANGEYIFQNLAPGTYAIFQHQPEEYFDGGDHVGSAGGENTADNLITSIVIGSGIEAVEYNFCEHVPLVLSGYVYHDRNNDGVRDPGEEGIAGVTLHLIDEQGNTVATAVTRTGPDTGYYEFDGLPAGTYSIIEVQPPGWLDGLDTAGNLGGVAHNPGDKISHVVMEWGDTGKNYNFGELLPGSIRGRVHVDLNGNCIYDPGEQLLEGVVIELLDADGSIIDITTTDADGEYLFNNLGPGEYSVRQQQPAGFFHGSQWVGSGGGVVAGDDFITQIFVHSGDTLYGYDFCEKPHATLSGYVFQDGPAIVTLDGLVPTNLDQLRDGAFKPDDKRIGGVVMELRHGVTGEPILGSAALPGTYAANQPITTVTDANGYYEFSGLPAGNYAVYQIHPEGYVDGIDTPGTAGGIAVNPHENIDPLFLFTLTEDPRNDAIIRIALNYGDHSKLNNFSEVLVVKTPPEFEPPPEWPTTPPMPESPAPAALAPLVGVAPQLLTPQPTSGSDGGQWYTWHLSVVNAGHPRGMNLSTQQLITAASAGAHTSAFSDERMRQGHWEITDREGNPIVLEFGAAGATPIVGDFNGDGVSNVGIYLDGQWFVDINGNGYWDPEDLWGKLGTADDRPVVGDWDGDGKADIGIFGPAWPGDPRAIQHETGQPNSLNEAEHAFKNLPPALDEATDGLRDLKLGSSGALRRDLIDHVFSYGSPSDIPVVGDWNGDGIATIGVFNDGVWYLDIDGDGQFTEADLAVEFGQPGDLPVVGDWTGNGISKLGVYRDGKFILDTNNNKELDAQDKVFEFEGGEGAIPVVGDWNGDGIFTPGIYRPAG